MGKRGRKERRKRGFQSSTFFLSIGCVLLSSLIREMVDWMEIGLEVHIRHLSSSRSKTQL